jgi:anti-sigma factor RsiW
MKPQNLHAHEDRLLDFIYGELPPLEARAVESHVEGCARCSELLAGIRGVRTTMAQLPMEPAPEAGLESLLAYAQQAARNAAAGPAPRPTWWRRWLMPAMGVAAVTVFGVLSTQVNKSLNLKEEVAAQSAAKNAEELPVTERAPRELPPAAQQKLAPQAQMAQVPSSPPPPQGYAQDAVADARLEPAGEAAALPAATPPPPAPAAKLDRSWLAKEAPRSKPSLPGRKGSRSDWSNVGTANGYGDSKDADLSDDQEQELSADTSYKKAKSFESDRRDAMTQAGPFPKPKPILAGAASEEPAQAAMPEPAPPAANQPVMNEEATGDGLVAEREKTQMEQQAPSQGALRIGGSRSRGNENVSPNKAAQDSSEDFDDLFGSGKKAVAKREQRASSGAGASAPPPPTASAAPRPMPTVSTSTPSVYRSTPSTRDEGKAEEKQASGSAELSKQADAAMRSGNRVREAELLRQALAAGATGKERLGLLNRLCDAEFAIGRRQAAVEACSLVLEEEPRSSAAQVARSRLRREGLEDASGKAGTGSRGPLKAAPVDKMEAPAQAQ